jgi:hypothetical protein
LSVDRFFGVFILLIAGIVVGLIVLLLEWLTFKYAVPYWRKRQWPGWLFCSQVKQDNDLNIKRIPSSSSVYMLY